MAPFIIIAVLLAVVGLSLIFWEGPKKHTSTPKTTKTQDTFQPKNSMTNALQRNEVIDLYNDKIIQIYKLQRENELLRSQLDKNKQEISRTLRLLKNYQQQQGDLTDSETEMNLLIDSLTRIVKEQTQKIVSYEKSDSDLEFTRHFFKNVLQDFYLQLQEVEEELSNGSQQEVQEEILKMKEKLKCLEEVQEILLYNSNMKINIQEEIGLVKKYLKMRGFLQHVQIRENRVEKNNYFYFTPLLPTGITLEMIENGIKHGDKHASDFMNIEFRLTENVFEMMIRNRLPLHQNSAAFYHGKGIENVKRRLNGIGDICSNTPVLTNNSDERYYYTSFRINFK